jgi:hypothetical protein
LFRFQTDDGSSRKETGSVKNLGNEEANEITGEYRLLFYNTLHKIVNYRLLFYKNIHEIVNFRYYFAIVNYNYTGYYFTNPFYNFYLQLHSSGSYLLIVNYNYTSYYFITMIKVVNYNCNGYCFTTPFYNCKFQIQRLLFYKCKLLL